MAGLDSQYLSGEARPLKPDEFRIIAALIRNCEGGGALLSRLPKSLVYEMKDGGMGSLRFASRDGGEQMMGRVLTEAWFTDRDGVLVSVTLNLDNHGDLFELDIWKVDFSALISLPAESEISFDQLKFISKGHGPCNRHFVIEQETGTGFYLYVFEGDRCTYDYLQDTFELAVKHAFEQFGVPEDSWERETG